LKEFLKTAFLNSRHWCDWRTNRSGKPQRWRCQKKATSPAAVSDVGPGGHYLGHPHTLEKFQSAFFMPELFDNNSIEQWSAGGEKEITQRALETARAMLSEYQEPKLDKARDEALLDYIARREIEIPTADELNQTY